MYQRTILVNSKRRRRTGAVVRRKLIYALAHMHSQAIATCIALATSPVAAVTAQLGIRLSHGVCFQLLPIIRPLPRRTHLQTIDIVELIPHNLQPRRQLHARIFMSRHEAHRDGQGWVAGTYINVSDVQHLLRVR